MEHISITKLYDLLTIKLGKETAENLTNFIQHKIQNEVDNKSQMLATKDDILRLDIKMEHLQAQNIKWMFIFWIGQVIATFGFILLFINK